MVIDPCTPIFHMALSYNEPNFPSSLPWRVYLFQMLSRCLCLCVCDAESENEQRQTGQRRTNERLAGKGLSPVYVIHMGVIKEGIMCWGK